jgi:hypothetical protein
MNAAIALIVNVSLRCSGNLIFLFAMWWVKAASVSNHESFIFSCYTLKEISGRFASNNPGARAHFGMITQTLGRQLIQTMLEQTLATEDTYIYTCL